MGGQLQVTKPGKEHCDSVDSLRSGYEARMAEEGNCCGCGAKARNLRFTCKVCNRGYCDDGSCFENRGALGCHCPGGIRRIDSRADAGSGDDEEDGSSSSGDSDEGDEEESGGSSMSDGEGEVEAVKGGEEESGGSSMSDGEGEVAAVKGGSSESDEKGKEDRGVVPRRQMRRLQKGAKKTRFCK